MSGDMSWDFSGVDDVNSDDLLYMYGELEGEERHDSGMPFGGRSDHGHAAHGQAL